MCLTTVLHGWKIEPGSVASLPKLGSLGLLHVAASVGAADILDFLAASLAPPVLQRELAAPDAENGWTPLHRAVSAIPRLACSDVLFASAPHFDLLSLSQLPYFGMKYAARC